MSAIFQRIAGMRDVLSLLAKVDFADISKAIELVKVIGDESAELRSRVLAVVDVAAILVEYTETEADDQVVQFCKTLANEDGVWQLVAIVQDLLDGGAVSPAQMQGQGLAYGSGQASGFLPWPMVIQLAQVIVMVIQLVRTKQ